jgi:SAM-dependent methyltransferase
MSEFDFEGVFDEDYLYFYDTFLTSERNAKEVDQVVALLERQPGREILDCPCGHGRITNALAEQGFSMTGLDATELFLKRARADARTRGLDVEYLHGDMRSLPWRDRFDGIVNWFTSFGYFDDATNREVARGFHDALRPGGRLVLETFNVLRLAKYEQRLDLVERGDDLMIDKVDFDPSTSVISSERIVVRDGGVRRANYRIRLYTFAELRALLESVGFGEVRPGIEPDAENRLVVVADRPPA